MRICNTMLKWITTEAGRDSKVIKPEMESKSEIKTPNIVSKTEAAVVAVTVLIWSEPNKQER